MIYWIGLEGFADKPEQDNIITLVPRSEAVRGFFEGTHPGRLKRIFGLVWEQEGLGRPIRMRKGHDGYGQRVVYAFFEDELTSNRVMSRLGSRRELKYGLEPGARSVRV